MAFARFGHGARPVPKVRQAKGRWNLYFYEPISGRRKAVALGTTSKREAEQIAAPIIARYMRGEFDPFSGRGSARALTVRQALDRFTAYCDRRAEDGTLSAATAADYKNALGSIIQPLPGGLMLGDLNAEHVRACVHRRELRPSSRKGYFVRLRRFLRWCEAEGLMRSQAWKAAEPPRKVKPIPAWLSGADFKHLVEVIAGDLDERRAKELPCRAHILHGTVLAVSTGLRLSELIALRWQDVDLAHGLVYVRNTDERRTKTGSERAVELNAMSAALLSRLQDQRQAMKVRPDRVLVQADGSHVAGPYLSHLFRKYRRDAELPEAIHFHSLRHTFASWHRLDGVPLDRIRDWMGHTDYAMTLVYAHLKPGTLALPVPSFEAYNPFARPAAA